MIPNSWWRSILTEGGFPDACAIVILSDIVYWYRPVEVRDEHTGRTVGYRKKFSGDMLRRSYQSWGDQFGFNKRQVAEACKRLAKQGLMRIEYREVDVGDGLKLYNVTFFEPNVEAILRISEDPDTESEIPPSDDGNGPIPNSVPTSTRFGETKKETTTETTGESSLSSGVLPTSAEENTETDSLPSFAHAQAGSLFEPISAEASPKAKATPAAKARRKKNSADAERSPADPRFTPIHHAIRDEFDKRKGQQDLTFPWGPAAAAMLNRVLRENPSWTAPQFIRCVAFRFQSDGVNWAENPMRWLSRITDYASGPRDRYGNLKGAEKVHVHKSRAQQFRDELDNTFREAREMLGISGEGDGDSGDTSGGAADSVWAHPQPGNGARDGAESARPVSRATGAGAGPGDRRA